MNFSQFLPLLITFIATLIGSYITIKVTMTELKKDLFYLKDKLENELVIKEQREKQSKEDFKEVKDELKHITKALNDIQLNFARMEARHEGKDEVISELKSAVTTIINNR